MSNRTAKLTLVEPLTDTDPMTAQDHYPRHLVISGVLAFCLSVWTIIILAIAHYT
ncbi:MAG TPA: hypothetical protein VJP60_07480 [Rhizomicrobium sp.]|nr:hypothetical protein [Rhizomicrobium sp.]